MLLGCSASDLQRPGWTIVATRNESDPTALLFEQRPLLSLVAPRRRTSQSGARAGVVAVVPELRGALTALLRDISPSALFTSDGLRALDDEVARLVPNRLTPPQEAHICIAYATRTGFQPYQGQWQEWIEPLDEAAETEPMALGLLARYGGGVYVVRQGATIISFAGIRQHSPSVAEIGVRTDAEVWRGHRLARAVVSRATRAVFTTERLPLYRYHAGNTASERVCLALGYRLYADSLAYFAPTR
jgi:RimJ/RimL family protein N-acetyltransferase